MGTGIIRGAIRSGFETVKSWFGSSSDNVSRDIGDSDSFRIKEASAQKIQKMNEELLSYSKLYSKQATNLENDVFEEMSDVLDNILDSLNDIKNIKINEKKIKIDIRSIKREMNKFKKQNTGVFINEIHRALSIDNRECLSILEMGAGKEKEKAMKNFLGSILKKELDSLANLMKETLIENLSYLEDLLTDKIIEIKETITEELENIKKLESGRNSDLKSRDLLLKSKIKEKIIFEGIING